jgi:hypothetical protein
MIMHTADITGSLKINEIPYNTGSFNVFDGAISKRVRLILMV